MSEHTGWLLDLYPAPEHRGEGVILWLLGDHDQRHRFQIPFPVTFYAAGPDTRLRALWKFLRDQSGPVILRRELRRDLFQKTPLPVLAVQCPHPLAGRRIFWKVEKRFPNLTYYNADTPLALRFSARYHTFPLARCRVTAEAEGLIKNIQILDTPWTFDPPPPPLRILTLRPDSNPRHREPTHLLVEHEQETRPLPFAHPEELLLRLGGLLHQHDPDLILTAWGDTWLIAHLLTLSNREGIPLPFNRDQEQEIRQHPERTFFSYGRVMYRGPKKMFSGRLHLDIYNAVMFHDYGLEGVLEMARVTGLPIQRAARVSPGTGISAMQMQKALEEDVLIPWHKQQGERPKSAYTLLQTDRGGMVYQPLIGLHPDVAEIDFTSMYPSIMVHFNISPETVGTHNPRAQLIPDLGLHIDQESEGLIPQTLAPLLNKRVELKSRLFDLEPESALYRYYRAQSSAHKWLLVTCFGYLGYKNARFGRIEAHEAVTAYGREALLRAKEAAETLGFRVLHMYVDGLWVQKKGASQKEDFQPLLEEIAHQTGLPITLDGIYRWIAFLPSRADPRIPVANRYFGVFQDGSLKMRGIELRRRDTPIFIKDCQRAVLEILAEFPTVEEVPEALPKAVTYLRERVEALRRGRISLEKLLVNQKLSRDLAEYRVPSPAARAAQQLAGVGKTVRVGQHVRFLYARGEPGVLAWDLPDDPNPDAVDLERYEELLIRAAHTVLGRLGVEEQTLRWWLLSGAGYVTAPGQLPEIKMQSAPLFNQSSRLVRSRPLQIPGSR